MKKKQPDGLKSTNISPPAAATTTLDGDNKNSTHSKLKYFLEEEEEGN